MEFVIPGEPKPKERPRKGKYGGMFTPKDTQLYEKRVQAAYASQGGIKFADNVPLIVSLQFYLPIPKSYSSKRRQALEDCWCWHKPDVDNVIKAVLDGLNGMAYEDDSRVVCVTASKRYSENPRVIVNIRELEGMK